MCIFDFPKQIEISIQLIMKKNLRSVIYVSTVLILSSCAPNILGTWSVSKYETVNESTQGSLINNLGTITFGKKGDGQKLISYNVLGVQRVDSADFKWKWMDNLMTIDSGTSDFSKTWIVIENSKNKQVWKATNGANQVQTIELIK